jgi:protein-disulfide isomerase
MPDRPNRRTTVVLPAVLAVVAALVAVVVGTSAADEETAGERPVAGVRTDAPAPVPSDDPLLAVTRREAGDPLAKGAVDAPVVIVEYSDFQCPFCGRFARETAPVLEQEYVDEGLVRIEWRDFPYLGPESTLAAQAGRAAAAQDRFWQFHDAMYADQPAPNSGSLTEERLVEVAREVGLDVDRFRRDLASESVAAAVQDDFTEGQSIGVTGTPAFLVNGRPVMGAQPVEVFRQLIDQGLAEAEAAR